jgi:hypothetical protein
LEFCTKIYYVKVSLVKPTVKSGSRGFIQNLFYKFWTFLQVFTNFGNLPYFLGFKTIGKTIKKCRTVTGLKLAHGMRRSARGLATRGRPEGRLGHGLAAQPSQRGGSRRTKTRCGDVLDSVAVGAGRRQGVAGEHQWGPGVAPGRRGSP